MSAAGPAIRLLPRLDDLNRFFWTGGADDSLQFLRCSGCRSYVHPPIPGCPFCEGGTLAPEKVSGHATLHSFTVNYQQWIPGSEPYVIGLVSIAEQEDVRLTTNIVECEPEDLRIGMELEVVFEPNGDVWLPLFRPMRDARSER